MAEDDESKKKSLAKLRDQHRKLDDEIARMTGGGAFNQLEVQRLKKRKLTLKDEIARLESEIWPDIIA